MKYLTNLIILFSSFSVYAQTMQGLYTPNGTVTGATTNSTNGFVGIGTNSPGSQLQLNGAIERQIFRIYKTGNTTNYLSIWQGAGGTAIDPIGTGVLYLGYDQVTNVLMNGSLGIGTTTPIAKLHVEGNIYVGTNQLQFLSASGGANRIQSAGGNGTFGTWTFKSRFDNIILDAGESTGNERQILFKTAGTDRMLVDYFGNVGIGTTSPDSKLAVKGTVHANEVKVDLNVQGPDYVFEPTYTLPSLDSVQSYINQNKHLPEVPSAKEMEANGVNVGEMNMLLLKKVEELTLYVIELSKQNKKMEIENDKLKNRVIQIERNIK